ncbi:MAG: SiaB family protein kinase [Bacteroidales bacterium]|nr:SiaB family protein kinase [Bacteroidales bacterium]
MSENKNTDNLIVDENENLKQIDLAYEMTKSVDEDYIEYVYRGNFSENITANILNLTDAKFVNDKDAYSSRKRISYLLIESLQNVIRHHDAPDDNFYSESLFVIQKTKDSIYITTANVVENNNIKKLKDYLTKIKGFTPEELKKEYHKILLDGVISEKGGGGLGIITMARRTNGRFNFEFKKIDDTYSYYYFQIRLIITEEPEKESVNELVSLKRISKFHSLLNKENILLNFNGSFAFENLESILPIIESHSIGGQEIKKRVFDLTVNMLRNIINFADEFHQDESAVPHNSRGVFLLSKRNNKLFLTAGNLILNDKALILKNKINIINNTETGSLIKIKDYLAHFFLYDLTERPDLSLIDMKLKNRSNINHVFKRINSKTSYFILQLVI